MGVGHSKPANKTGKNVVRQKIETASKTGVLSLREHSLTEIPLQVFELTNVRTLDLSNNKLKQLSSKLTTLTKLKSLKCDGNLLRNGSLSPIITKLPNLQIFSAGENKLGLISPPTTSKDSVGSRRKNEHGNRSTTSFPNLPPALKQLKLDSNHFESIPMQICDPNLIKLEKLDLSRNNLATIPPEISNLSALTELNLDGNCIVSLPEEIGKLAAMKALSLQHNQIQVHSTSFSAGKPQPLPAVLFTETPLIDLNLRGNQLTNTQLVSFMYRLAALCIYSSAITHFPLNGFNSHLPPHEINDAYVE